MGRFKNSKCVMIFAILTAFCLFVINAIGLVPIGGKIFAKLMNNIVPGWVYAPFSIVFALYIGLIIIVLRAPLSPIMEHKDSEIDEGFDKVVSLYSFLIHLYCRLSQISILQLRQLITIDETNVSYLIFFKFIS